MPSCRKQVLKGYCPQNAAKIARVRPNSYTRTSNVLPHGFGPGRRGERCRDILRFLRRRPGRGGPRQRAVCRSTRLVRVCGAPRPFDGPSLRAGFGYPAGPIVMLFAFFLRAGRRVREPAGRKKKPPVLRSVTNGARAVLFDNILDRWSRWYHTASNPRVKPPPAAIEHAALDREMDGAVRRPPA